MKLATWIVLILISMLTLANCRHVDHVSSSNNLKLPQNSEKNSDSRPLDLNSATKAELIRLPGVGEAYAQRIIDHRPYRQKNELLDRNIIPASVYYQISDQIIAKQH